MLAPARLEELAREDRRGASSLLTITEDRPRYTNLLLLLRITAEITATVMVAKVALTTLGFQFWVGLLLVAVMVVVTYVGIGVLPRTIGRQHIARRQIIRAMGGGDVQRRAIGPHR